jgi:hypothetical protein
VGGVEVDVAADVVGIDDRHPVVGGHQDVGLAQVAVEHGGGGRRARQ